MKVQFGRLLVYSALALSLAACGTTITNKKSGSITKGSLKATSEQKITPLKYYADYTLDLAPANMNPLCSPIERQWLFYF